MAKSFALSILLHTVDRASANIKRINQAMDGLTRKAKQASKQLGVVGKKMTRNLTVPIVALGAAATRSFASFEDGMSNVQTLTGDTNEVITAMGKEVQAIGSRVPVTLASLTTGLKDLRSGGIGAGDAMGFLEQASGLGVAAMGTTEQGVKLLTASYNNFGATAEDAAEIFFRANKAGITNVEQLAQGFGKTAPIVASFGITLKDYAATVAAMTTTSTTAAEVNTQLRAILAGAGKQGAAAFMKLIKESGGLPPALVKIRKQLGGGFTALKKYFGSVEAVAGILSITGKQNKAYTETLKGMNSGIRLLPDALAVKTRTLKASGQFTKNALAGVAITIGKLLTPALKEAAEQLQAVSNWFSQLSPSTQKWIVKIAGLVAILGPLLIIIGKLIPAFGLFAKAVLFLGGVFKTLTMIMLTNPILLLITAIAVAALLIWQYWDPIAIFFADLWERVKGPFIAFAKFAALLFAPVVLVLMAVWDPLKVAFKVVWDAITAIIKAAVKIIMVVIKAVLGAIKAVLGAIKAVVELASDAIDAFTSETLAPSLRLQQIIKDTGEPGQPALADPIAAANVANQQIGGGPPQKADVTVTFENAPPGTRVIASPFGNTANLSLKTGLQVTGF